MPSPDAHEHHLDESEPVFFHFSMIVLASSSVYVAEELPLGRPQPENGFALLIDEISAVLAHLERVSRFLGRAARRKQEHRGGQYEHHLVIHRSQASVERTNRTREAPRAEQHFPSGDEIALPNLSRMDALRGLRLYDSGA